MAGHQGIQRGCLQLSIGDDPGHPPDDDGVIELVSAARIPFLIETHLQVRQGQTHFETDPGITAQIVGFFSLGRAVEVHAPLVEDEVQGGDVRVSMFMDARMRVISFGSVISLCFRLILCTLTFFAHRYWEFCMFIGEIHESPPRFLSAGCWRPINICRISYFRSAPCGGPRGVSR